MAGELWQCLVPGCTTTFPLALLLPRGESHEMSLHTNVALQTWKRNEIVNNSSKKAFIRDQDCYKESNKLIQCSPRFYRIFISFQPLQFSF